MGTAGLMVPSDQSKERQVPLLQCPWPLPPSPDTLGAAVGQPMVVARQGRQLMGQGAAPCRSCPQ